jgi:hypothetical protein
MYEAIFILKTKFTPQMAQKTGIVAAEKNVSKTS